MTFLPQALAKGLRMEMMPGPAWGDLVGDGLKVRQVAANLVSNAIKYTPPGGRVRVGFERDDPECCPPDRMHFASWRRGEQPGPGRKHADGTPGGTAIAG